MSYVTNLPVNGSFNVTAVFGQKGSLWANGHKGIDITASNKTLYSVCDGVVTVVGWDKDGWGRYVSVKPDGFERIRFILCHMVENSVKVKKGDKVSRMTALGTMGTSGNSTGVHVHVEMRIDNKSVDPTPYLLISNKKANGLNGTNFKFDAAFQKTALAAMLDEFDGKKIEESDNSKDTQIAELKKEISLTKEKLSLAEAKIKNAKKALE